MKHIDRELWIGIALLFLTVGIVFAVGAMELTNWIDVKIASYGN